MQKNNFSKWIAIITGFISILICIIYLLIVTLLDNRLALNNFLNTSLHLEMEVEDSSSHYDSPSY